MDRFLYLTVALAATLALSAPAAQAGLHLNGPALDGQQVVLPDGSQTIGRPAAEEAQKLASNGPALDGRQVGLPDGLRIGGTPMMEFQRLASNGPALDGRQVMTPDLAGLAVDRRRLPSDIGAVLPIDQRRPNSGRNWLAQP